MASEVRLPRLGQGMESGTIVKWLKAEGDRVEKGEPLFEVDTDKATQEVEAEASGVLLSIAVNEGEVPVGQMVALIGEPGEIAAEPAAATNGGSVPAEAPARPPASGPAREAAPRRGGGEFRSAIIGALDSDGRIKASPLARRMARERGIDLQRLRGSGPDGRIIAEDVELAGAPAAPAADAPFAAAEPAPEPDAAASAEEPQAPAERGEAPAAAAAAEPPPPAEHGEVESIPLTKLRRTIARRLGAAWEIPVFQLTVSVDMTHANALVARSRELNPDVRVTITDLLAKVCARALVRHAELNVQFAEDALLRFPSANIGIAVAAPQGLVVPVIAAVERLSLVETAQQRAALVARAREGRLAQQDLEGGTFTISNLGMFGVEQFTAVLNPPQAAILAVGATVERPVVSGGEIVAAPMMSMTLTVDHRAVDGGPAAEFLQTVKTFLEDPALAL
jgi:pyruvate dehydrogenase E2 component (dihydrolipoamide acetyltransferase)